MAKPTPAEDRALVERVVRLPRKAITFNVEEIWYLYRLVVADRSTRTPCILPELHAEHEFTGGTALAKLSEAHVDLTTPKETRV